MNNLKNLIKYLDDKYSIGLESTSLKRDDILSFVSEVIALIFFDMHFELSDIQSEDSRKANMVKTPDWIFKIDSQIVFVEVYRQNISGRNSITKVKSALNEFVALDINNTRMSNRNIAAKYDKYIPLIQEKNALYFIFLEIDLLGDDDKVSLFCTETPFMILHNLIRVIIESLNKVFIINMILHDILMELFYIKIKRFLIIIIITLKLKPQL